MTDTATTLTEPPPWASDPHAPRWIADWIARPAAIGPEKIFTQLGAAPESFREAACRYPLGCVVRCDCGDPGCCRYSAVVGLHMEQGSNELHLSLVAGPTGNRIFCGDPKCTYLHVVAYRGGLTETDVRHILMPAGNA